MAMAAVAGQAAFFSPALIAEYNTLPVDIEEDNDDEYAYVSRLAQQVAQAMLDEEEEGEEIAAEKQVMECCGRVESSCRQESGWSRERLRSMESIEEAASDNINSVSQFAAAWRENGPSEWECFYTPSVSPTQLSFASSRRTVDDLQSMCYTENMQLLYPGWNPCQHGGGKKRHQKSNCGSHLYPGYDLSSQSGPTGVGYGRMSYYYMTGSPVASRMMPVGGTGVFLPKVSSVNSHAYRRKHGAVSPLVVRKVYAQRKEVLC